MLEAEADRQTQTAWYERNKQRPGGCGTKPQPRHHFRNGALNVPWFNGIAFETVIIELYRLQEGNVKEALVEMDMTGLCDITKALRGSKESPSTISGLNKKALAQHHGLVYCPPWKVGIRMSIWMGAPHGASGQLEI